MNRFELKRRTLLGAGVAGLGLIGLPALGQDRRTGFAHGVASGDPKQSSVVLWTRYRPADGRAARISVEIAEDEQFANGVMRDDALALPFADHCVKVRPTGLEPGRWYYYRFTASNGEVSPTGRTRTLPARGTDPFRIAVLCCANKEFGFFNACAHLAARDDVDLVLHLGDYIYEWGNGQHSQAAKAMPERAALPADEVVTLMDYRARYADYRSDPDLAELHRRLPMISIIDDHETANNSWRGGAGNHQPDEGPWEIRKRVAMQAYHEWLPMPDTPYDRYNIGDLATIFRLESRLLARDKPLDTGDVIEGAANPLKALRAFRDGPLNDPDRTLLGATQERWLGTGFENSVASGQRWQVVAQQVVMGEITLPQNAASTWFDPAKPIPPKSLHKLEKAALLARADVPLSMQNWSGYPAARSRFLDSAIAAKANLITLSGDSHNAWAFDLAKDNQRAGVELAAQSITSLGWEARFNGDPSRIASDLRAMNPSLRWCNMNRRGYYTLNLTRNAAKTEWIMLDTTRHRSKNVAATQSANVDHGARKLQMA